MSPVTRTQATTGPRHTHAARRASLSRVLDRIERAAGRDPDLAELSQLAGVSPRTLRSMFAEVFGVSPARYLRLRRLHQMRAALSMADPALHTVAGICERFRLSDAGRAASEYHALFGEYPSTTLARPLPER